MSCPIFIQLPLHFAKRPLSENVQFLSPIVSLSSISFFIIILCRVSYQLPCSILLSDSNSFSKIFLSLESHHFSFLILYTSSTSYFFYQIHLIFKNCSLSGTPSVVISYVFSGIRIHFLKRVLFRESRQLPCPICFPD